MRWVKHWMMLVGHFQPRTFYDSMTSQASASQGVASSPKGEAPGPPGPPSAGTTSLLATTYLCLMKAFSMKTSILKICKNCKS